MQQMTPDTPLSFMTYGDLRKLMYDMAQEIITSLNNAATPEPAPKRYARSIGELAEALGCCAKTAQKLKNTKLKPIVMQLEGSRTFLIDIDEALNLMKQ